MSDMYSTNCIFIIAAHSKGASVVYGKQVKYNYFTNIFLLFRLIYNFLQLLKGPVSFVSNANKMGKMRFIIAIGRNVSCV